MILMVADCNLPRQRRQCSPGADRRVASTGGRRGESSGMIVEPRGSPGRRGGPGCCDRTIKGEPMSVVVHEQYPVDSWAPKGHHSAHRILGVILCVMAERVTPIRSPAEPTRGCWQRRSHAFLREGGGGPGRMLNVRRQSRSAAGSERHRVASAGCRARRRETGGIHPAGAAEKAGNGWPARRSEDNFDWVTAVLRTRPPPPSRTPSQHDERSDRGGVDDGPRNAE